MTDERCPDCVNSRYELERTRIALAKSVVSCSFEQDFRTSQGQQFDRSMMEVKRTTENLCENLNSTIAGQRARIQELESEVEHWRSETNDLDDTVEKQRRRIAELEAQAVGNEKLMDKMRTAEWRANQEVERLSDKCTTPKCAKCGGSNLPTPLTTRQGTSWDLLNFGPLPVVCCPAVEAPEAPPIEPAAPALPD